MKKNLRIVSAAAAALLAVAPVAASGVVAPANTVSAADKAPKNKAPKNIDSVDIGTVSLDRATNTPFTVKLNDTQRAILADKAAKAAGVKGAEIDSIVVTSAESQANGEIKQTLVFTLKGQSGSYTTDVTAKFASQQGTPYFYQTRNNTILNNGDTVSLDTIANGFTPASLLSDIAGENGIVGAKTSDASNDGATITTTASDVESQLIAQGLKRASNGEFDYPANGFNLKLTAKSENGNTASITVRVNSKVNYNAPAFVVNNKVYYSGNIVATDISKVDNNIIVNALDKNGKYSADDVKAAVTAHVQSAYSNKNATNVAELEGNEATKAVINSSKISVDSSSVKSEPGIYPVIVTATNPAGLTSELTVKVIVMGSEHQAPVQYAKADNTKVYNINGNVVSETKTTLNKDQAVKTFDSVTIDGVQYTQINSENSNEWVKASDLTATKPAPETVASVSKTIMHNAYYYNKEGQRVGTEKATRYDSVTVAPKTTTINGKTYYQVVENGKAVDKYINAGNIDGTKRTLKHNAYVYKTSKKRAKKVVLKKGDTVTTYGASYKFKNGKRYYKIGNNTDKTYVKVANFR
ncbi:SLAP domain-containing protein [Lactobacillus kefiranofaciens]|nr:SLAP domain-containing protein [Lactobacillus kefiranofaciens]